MARTRAPFTDRIRSACCICLARSASDAGSLMLTCTSYFSSSGSKSTPAPYW
ncbi:hypothetical protein Mx9_p96 [Myxococcus phage Mx9]|nr:hypothetical protein Mx9_p96 [Myxococcus phage Mx9]